MEHSGITQSNKLALVQSKSPASAGFPLSHLIVLVNSMHVIDGDAMEYYQNVRNLTAWLAPIDIPDLPEKVIPRMHYNWIVENLADAVRCRKDVIYQLVRLMYP